MIAKARTDLEWAERVFDESVAPHVVDVDRLVGSIRDALAVRKAELESQKATRS